MNSLPTKVLVATDGLQNAVAARSAAEIARAFGSELHVVHVVPITEPYHLFDKDAEGPSLYEEDRQRAQELLDEQVRRIEENGGKVTNMYLRTGEPDAEVVLLGEEIGANMIVAGSRGARSAEATRQERLKQHRGARPPPGACGEGRRAGIAAGPTPWIGEDPASRGSLPTRGQPKMTQDNSDQINGPNW